MGRASPPPLPTNPPCAAKGASHSITAPAANDIQFSLPAVCSRHASLHIVETEGLARPDGLGPGLAVPEVNIEKMVELRLAKAGDDARLGRKFCETVACRIVTRPVANECAARNARLGEANPAGGDAFAEAAILVTDGASDRREIVERPEQIGDFRPMRGALGTVAPRRCAIVEKIGRD